MLRLVFMGSDAIALPALDWLAASGAVEFPGVYTQPDRPAGRGQKVQPNAIKLWAAARAVPVFQPDRLGAVEQAGLAALAPDLILVMAYGHILRQGVIDLPRLGIYNLHTSLLPKFRGASPIQTAVACGESVTGVTLMRLVLQLDAGPVVDVERVAVAPLDTATQVETKLAHACVPLLQRALPALAAGAASATPQVEADATFCRRLDKGDAALDFSAPAAALASRINGLNPWPGCAVAINGQAVKIGLADAIEVAIPAGAGPGTVLGADAEGLLVATCRGVLRLRRLQRPGGKLLAADEFLRGFPVAPGSVLPSAPMAPLVALQPFPYRRV